MAATAVRRPFRDEEFIPSRRDDVSDPALLCLLPRVRAEFREMPGLRLTVGQARRLFGIPEDVCQRILLTLIAEGFLFRGVDGRFSLRSDN